MGNTDDVRQNVQQAIAALTECARLLEQDPVDWPAVQRLLLRARGWLQVAQSSAMLPEE